MPLVCSQYCERRSSVFSGLMLSKDKTPGRGGKVNRSVGIHSPAPRLCPPGSSGTLVSRQGPVWIDPDARHPQGTCQAGACPCLQSAVGAYRIRPPPIIRDPIFVGAHLRVRPSARFGGRKRRGKRGKWRRRLVRPKQIKLSPFSAP
jgi:hypothetical protein